MFHRNMLFLSSVWKSNPCKISAAELSCHLFLLVFCLACSLTMKMGLYVHMKHVALQSWRLFIVTAVVTSNLAYNFWIGGENKWTVGSRHMEFYKETSDKHSYESIMKCSSHVNSFCHGDCVFENFEVILDKFKPPRICTSGNYA